MVRDVAYAEELYQAVDCLADFEDLPARLRGAADFIIPIRDDTHFPKSEAGEGQLAKFVSIRERLFGAGAKQALNKLTTGQQRQLSHDIVGLAFESWGSLIAKKKGDQPKSTP